MASGTEPQPVGFETTKIPVLNNTSFVVITKYGRVAFFKFFTDQNIPDGTILTTLPTYYQPYNDASYPEVVYASPQFDNSDVNHFVQVRMDGDVKYVNKNNTSTWNVFHVTYMTK